MSHTGINVYAHCPLHLPKIVSKKPSVNHIGSSTSHQLCAVIVLCLFWQVVLVVVVGLPSKGLSQAVDSQQARMIIDSS